MTKTPPNSNSSKKLVETCPPFISHPIMNFKMKIGLQGFSFEFTFEVFSQKKEAGTFCGKDNKQYTLTFLWLAKKSHTLY